MTEDRVPRTQAGRDMVAWQAGINGFDRAYWDRRVVEIEDQASEQPAPPLDDKVRAALVEVGEAEQWGQVAKGTLSTLHAAFRAEAEQPTPLLDVERLVRVFHILAAEDTGMPESDYEDEDFDHWRYRAQTIAAEYARLGSAPSRSEPE